MTLGGGPSNKGSESKLGKLRREYNELKKKYENLNLDAEQVVHLIYIYIL